VTLSRTTSPTCHRAAVFLAAETEKDALPTRPAASSMAVWRSRHDAVPRARSRRSASGRPEHGRALPLAAGTKGALALLNARIMIHQPLGGAGPGHRHRHPGPRDPADARRSPGSSHTGSRWRHPARHRPRLFMSPEQAREYGLVDEVPSSARGKPWPGKRPPAGRPRRRQCQLPFCGKAQERSEARRRPNVHLQRVHTVCHDILWSDAYPRRPGDVPAPADQEGAHEYVIARSAPRSAGRRGAQPLQRIMPAARSAAWSWRQCCSSAPPAAARRCCADSEDPQCLAIADATT
jgi:hypothetical protein